MIGGYEIQVSKYLEGMKKAVKLNGIIYLSPAMWDLVKHAETQEELRHLLENIPLVDMGTLPNPWGLPLMNWMD
jgi:hypothetical protein